MEPRPYKTFDEWFASAHPGTPPPGSAEAARAAWDAAVRAAYECVAANRFPYVERKEYVTGAAVRDAAWQMLNELASEECLAAMRREVEERTAGARDIGTNPPRG
jgi:hypothetical protein